MPFDVSIKHDLKELQRGLRGLEKRAVPRATVRTLNRVAASTKTASARHIAPQMGSRRAGVKGSIEILKSTKGRLWAALRANERPLPLIEFVVGSKKLTARTRRPVKARAWGKTRIYRGAFIAPRRRGDSKTTIYIRKNRKKLPVKQLFGPGIKQLFKQKENQQVMEKVVRERLPKEFKSNLSYYASRLNFRKRKG